MSFPYHGPSKELRLRMQPSTVQLPPMPDMPARQQQTSKPVAKKSKSATPKATWEQREKAAQAKVKRAQNASAKKATSVPTFKENQHPRDRFGRFMRKAGKVALGATKKIVKGVVTTVKVTHKVAKGTHKAVKRSYSNARKQDELALRERRLKLREREAKLRKSRGRKRR